MLNLLKTLKLNQIQKPITLNLRVYTNKHLSALIRQLVNKIQVDDTLGIERGGQLTIRSGLLTILNVQPPLQTSHTCMHCSGMDRLPLAMNIGGASYGYAIKIFTKLTNYTVSDLWYGLFGLNPIETYQL